MLITLTLLFMLAAYAGEVSPWQTDSEITEARGPHIAIDGASRSTVVLIGGTGSKPSDYAPIIKWASELGHRVLAIDYPNGVISTVCRNHPDPLCFDNFREEISFGKDVSELVSINRVNSIDNRIQKLVEYLRWDFNWENVILVGHSQGSGHAAYLAKKFSVRKVIMVAGPQDNFENSGPAHWTRVQGRTDSSRYFAFLHEKDFFGVKLQLATASVLTANGKVIYIRDRIPLLSTGQIFVSNLPVRDPHNSFWELRFEKVWKRLLR